MMRHLLLGAATTAIAIANSIVAPSQNQSDGVVTTSGFIIGHAAQNRSQVTEYLGIRYAEAPVGKLRFAAPKSFVASEHTIYEASQWVGLHNNDIQ